MKRTCRRSAAISVPEEYPPTTIDDLVQDAFVVLVKKRGCILNGKGKSYLFGIAFRVLINYRRKALLERVRRHDDGSGTADGQRKRDSKCASAIAEEHEIMDMLEKAVYQLSPQLQRLTRLMCLDRVSRSEVAQAMGITMKSTYEFEKRAIEHLRKIFESKS